jgi:M6 family metalloprotease-like protein
MNASPFPFRERQPDGSLTPLLKMMGNTEHHKIVDMDGYTVIEDSHKWFVYATKDPSTGRLKSSGLRVGKSSPSRAGLPKGLEEPRKMETMRNLRASPSIGLSSPESQDRRLQIAGKLRNLVVLIRFADHVNRPLPPTKHYDIIFNRRGGHSKLAPTGSVKDVFTQSSFGKLEITSKVTPWITLPHTEKYYADGDSGLTSKIKEGLLYALQKVDGMKQFKFKNFDLDNNGEIDVMTFVHSGYAAEIGARDCYGGEQIDRIWSHKWGLRSPFISQGVKVQRYSINPGLWKVCDNEISHIGVIAHEIGHFLGLPDLYDGDDEGHGIGSYDLMSNSWGVNGMQTNPPIMSAWSRAQLGWIQPQVIDRPGKYTVPAVANNPVAFKITKGFPNGEYLLIENRARIGFDSLIKQPGLAIWHIDENAESSDRMNRMEGHPGQHNWPHNGKHYRIALLQADGNYDLERGNNKHDAGDLFHGQGVSKLTPSKSNSGPFPNTDSYQGGNIRSSGWYIHDISNAGETMTFTLSDSEPKPPTIETTWDGDKTDYGAMFDISARTDLSIDSIEINVATTEKILVEVYTREGSAQHTHDDGSGWKRLARKRISGRGKGNGTPISFNNPVDVYEGDTQSFYVRLVEKPYLVYSTGDRFGKKAAKNDDMVIKEGYGKKSRFGSESTLRIFNGLVHYNTL